MAIRKPFEPVPNFKGIGAGAEFLNALNLRFKQLHDQLQEVADAIAKIQDVIARGDVRRNPIVR